MVLSVGTVSAVGMVPEESTREEHKIEAQLKEKVGQSNGGKNIRSIFSGISSCRAKGPFSKFGPKEETA